MSKRDKAKAARKAARDAMSRNPLLTVPIVSRAAGVPEADLARFLDGDSDALDIATALADHFRVTLPEIEVWDYRASGYLPEALVNFLALLGWNPGLKTPDGKDLEKFDAAFLAQHFGLERIGRTSARFDRVKLLSFNADALAALSDAEFLERLRRWAGQFDTALRVDLDRQPPARLDALVRMARPRCRVLRDFAKVVAFALVDDEALAFDDSAMDKQVRAGRGAEVLRAFEAHLSHAPDSEPVAPEPVEAWVKARAEDQGLKMGEVAQPLRVALTGGTVSPPLGEVAAVLGRASARRRIARCLERVAVNA
jgi:glutamyl-tRNA synthetase